MMRFLFLFMMICSWYAIQAQSYDIVLATDFDGNVTKGSKAALIDYIREGKPVRVGWQLDFNGDKKPDFDHWVEATYITILEEEVFTQIDPIYAQGPNRKVPQVEIYPDGTKWTAVIGTNSKLLNRFIQNNEDIPELVFDDSMDISDEEKQEIIQKEEERKLAMKEVRTWKVATFWSAQK